MCGILGAGTWKGKREGLEEIQSRLGKVRVRTEGSAGSGGGWGTSGMCRMENRFEGSSL